MKFVIAADGHSEIHERACAAALRELGHEVHELYWAPYFRSVLGIGRDEFRSLTARIGNKLIAGPVVRRYNRDLAAACEREQPDVVITYRGTHVLPSTLRVLRERTAARLVSINNDDPCSPGASRMQWRHLLAGISEYDVNFVYRHQNIEDYENSGARNVHLLRSFYIPQRNYPVTLAPDLREQFGSDVVFAGHYEPDGRAEALELLIGKGVNLRIYGPGWHGAFRRRPMLRRIPEPEYLDGDRYNLVLNASKIVLSFLSSLNRDTYTRRCFEVPASGAFLLSQYSDDLATLFDEGREIAFFRNADELAAMTEHYLVHADERRAIANAGHARVMRDGHDAIGRMRELLAVVEAAGAKGHAR